jgi:hypothetical protein
MNTFNPETDLFIPNEFLNHPNLSHHQQFIISYILKYSKNGICHMKKKELAEISHSKYGTFRLTLSALRKKGFIKDIDNGLAIFLNNEHYILDRNIYGKEWA